MPSVKPRPVTPSGEHGIEACQVNRQVLMTATVLNLKRLMVWVGRRRSMEASAPMAAVPLFFARFRRPRAPGAHDRGPQAPPAAHHHRPRPCVAGPYRWRPLFFTGLLTLGFSDGAGNTKPGWEAASMAEAQLTENQRATSDDRCKPPLGGSYANSLHF